MIRPCKTRDSARSALQTAVRDRRSGLALHPLEGYYRPCGRPLTGAAEYAWGARAYLIHPDLVCGGEEFVVHQVCLDSNAAIFWLASLSCFCMSLNFGRGEPAKLRHIV